MKFKKLPILLSLCFWIAVAPAAADSPVWKVAKDGNTLFIGGTVHLLTQADYPLPDTFEAAYQASSIIVFETDFQKMQSPEFQQALLQQVAYPDGITLKDTLDQGIYAVFEDYLKQRGLPGDNLVKFKAGMVSITLTMIELQRLGLTGTGVDQFFSLKALNDRKKIGKLETLEEQVAFIARMGEGHENELIAYTMKQMKNLPTLMKVLKAAWRNGDRRQLDKIGLEPMKEQFPDIYADLILKRNKAWVPKIEAMIQTPEVEFVLFGALHLAGNDGVLAQLEAKGYKTESLLISGDPSGEGASDDRAGDKVLK